MLVVKNTIKVQYTWCRNCVHKNYIHLHIHLNIVSLNVILSHQYLHYILQLIDQLVFFTTYNFYNLNILQHHMINHIHILSYSDFK